MSKGTRRVRWTASTAQQVANDSRTVVQLRKLDAQAEQRRLKALARPVLTWRERKAARLVAQVEAQQAFEAKRKLSLAGALS